MQASRYECSRCGSRIDRALLIAKRVLFQKVGKHQKIMRSRTVGWLCPDCIKIDPDWNRKAYDDSPGLKEYKDG